MTAKPQTICARHHDERKPKRMIVIKFQIYDNLLKTMVHIFCACVRQITVKEPSSFCIIFPLRRKFDNKVPDSDLYPALRIASWNCLRVNVFGR